MASALLLSLTGLPAVITESLTKMYQEPYLSDLSLAGLAHRCRQETERYYAQLEHREQYCYELFRRAIVHQDEQSWYLLVDQYSTQVAAWVRRQPSFTMVDEECDFFVNYAFARFWRAFRDPAKLDRFPSLPALLQYLKLCAYAAVQEHIERYMKYRPVEDLEYPAAFHPKTTDMTRSIDGALEAERIWQRVLEVAKTDQERIIAVDYFVYDIKPREIYDRHPDLFTSVSRVQHTKDNFVARLRRDKVLLGILAEHA